MTLRIAIIAPVATDQYNDRLLKGAEPVIPPDVEVQIFNLPAGQGTLSIENRTNWLENGFPVVKLAQQLEQQGFDGIWLSDFDMCGVEAAREVIDIPIIGGFTACAFTAMALGQKFSIVTILPSTLAMQQGHAFTYGLTESFASIHSIDCPVEQLSDEDIVTMKAFQAAEKAIKEDGAQTILLGCTGFVGIAERVSIMLQESVGAFVPVIDPNQAGFSFLVSLVRMKQRPSRLCYSKVQLPS